ncbi:MAG: DMT family transporter [Planctomycetaceae bacterium]|nr:DMT family transporter [Planctomycetaceae bacterium]
MISRELEAGCRVWVHQIGYHVGPSRSLGMSFSPFAPPQPLSFRTPPVTDSTPNSTGDAETPVWNPWPDLSLLGVALIWGINIPVMKNGLEQIDHFVFNAVRLVISAIALGMLAWWERRRAIQLPEAGKPSWGQLTLYAMIVSGVYQLLFLIGVARTTSGNTALIFATVPLWTALMARAFFGETIRRLAWVGLIIALFGTAVVALQKGNVTVSGQHSVGNLVVLLAAMVWAGGTAYTRPLLRNISPLQLAALGAAMALPMHLLIAAQRLPESLPALRSPGLWGIIFYSGLLSTGMALPMWNYGIRHAGAAHGAVVQNLVPVIAIIAAWITRGEVVTTGQICGGLLILGGLISMRFARETPVTQTTPGVTAGEATATQRR